MRRSKRASDSVRLALRRISPMTSRPRVINETSPIAAGRPYSTNRSVSKASGSMISKVDDSTAAGWSLPASRAVMVVSSSPGS